MFDHFGQRLKRDLKKLVDRRIIESETASRSLIRVCCLPANFCSFLTRIPTRAVFWCRGQCHFPQETAVCSLVRWCAACLVGALDSILALSNGLNKCTPTHSPIFTRIVILKPTTKKWDLASVGDTRSSEARLEHNRKKDRKTERWCTFVENTTTEIGRPFIALNTTRGLREANLPTWTEHLGPNTYSAFIMGESPTPKSGRKLMLMTRKCCN